MKCIKVGSKVDESWMKGRYKLDESEMNVEGKKMKEKIREDVEGEG